LINIIYILNLALSCIASTLQAPPIIMMSQNRQEEKDRISRNVKQDYEKQI
jgi:uncharacterized membrane protein